MIKGMTGKLMLGLAVVLAGVGTAQAGLVFSVVLMDGASEVSAKTFDGTTLHVGDTLTFKVYANATGVDANYTNDGFQTAYTYWRATGTGIKGNMTAAAPGQAEFAPSWYAPAYTDLNADGYKDIGSMATGTGQTTGYMYTRAGSILMNTGNGTPSYYLATFNYVVGALPTATSSTTVSGGFYPQSSGLLWKMDAAQKFGTSSPAPTFNGVTLNFTVTTTTYPAIGTSSPLTATIITGGTATLGATVSNTGDPGTTLNYGVAAAAKADGSAFTTLGAPWTNQTGALAQGASAAVTLTASSTHVGTNIAVLTVSDINASNNPQTVETTLNVLAHSDPSFLPDSDLAVTTLSFGNVLRNATLAPQPFAITNRGDSNTAKLSLTGFTNTGLTPFSTTLAPFIDHPPGGTDPFTASMGTADNYAGGQKTVNIYTIDQDLPGKTTKSLTLYVTGVVGNATANRSENVTAFGPPLTAHVAQPTPGDPLANPSYAGLESTVFSVQGSGGSDPLSTSVAKLLGGTNSSGPPETVSMAWRTRTTAEAGPGGLVSDVLSLTGMENGGSNPQQTDIYVLQVKYDASKLTPLFTELQLANMKAIELAYRTSTGWWDEAINGNVGSNTTNPALLGFVGPWNETTIGYTLGAWGVDTNNHVAWAVLDHNSDFAVVPEPATLAFLALGGLTMAGAGLSRRRRKA